MRLRKIAIPAALALLMPVVALAGEKCPYSTQECLDYMANKMKDSGWVGVELDDSDPAAWPVTRVIEDSPAEAAGIQVGDVLVAINGIPMSERERMAEAREAWKPGSDVTWTMTRGTSPRDLQITLGRMPADVLAKFIGQHMLEHAAVDVASDGDTPPRS